MGWLGPVVGNVQHEGYVVPFFADGVEGAGSYSNRGVLVDFDRDEWRPDDKVTGWRAGCECGWRGPDWERAEGNWPPAWGHVNKHTNQLCGDDAFLDDDAENAVMEAWRAHIRPWKALEDVGDLAERAAEAVRELDAAVASARSGGATWADIGRAVGITRQSARERWATKLGDVRDW